MVYYFFSLLYEYESDYSSTFIRLKIEIKYNVAL